MAKMCFELFICVTLLFGYTTSSTKSTEITDTTKKKNATGSTAHGPGSTNTISSTTNSTGNSSSTGNTTKSMTNSTGRAYSTRITKSADPTNSPESINNSPVIKSKNELRKYLMSLIYECYKEYPIQENFMQQLKDNNMIPKNAMCLFACVYKRGGMMDENGLMSVRGVYDLTKNYVTRATMDKVMFRSRSRDVNDAKVSDGSKGCDRAPLIFLFMSTILGDVFTINDLSSKQRALIASKIED